MQNQDMIEKIKTNVYMLHFSDLILTAIIQLLMGSKKYKINLINDCG